MLICVGHIRRMMGIFPLTLRTCHQSSEWVEGVRMELDDRDMHYV